MGEATIEAPALSSGGPIMAARAGGSSATDCSIDALPQQTHSLPPPGPSSPAAAQHWRKPL